MKIASFSVFILFSFQFVFAQSSTLFNSEAVLDLDDRSNIQLYLGGMTGSKTLTNQFGKNFFIGSKLDKDLINNQYRKLENNNQLCYIVPAYLRFNLYNSNFKYFNSLRLEFASMYYNDITFDKNLFGLYFLGNKPFLNTTLGISATSTNYTYHVLKLGSAYRKGIFEVKYNLGLVSGQNLATNEIVNSRVTTSGLGESIDLNLNYQSTHLTNGLNKSNLFNGIGVALDLGLSLKYANGNFVSLEINDFGKIYWDNTISRTSLDTHYIFEGVEVAGFFDSLYFDIGSSENLRDKFISRKNLSQHQTILPYSINIFAHYHWKNKKIYSNINCRVYPESFFVGSVDVETYYKYNKHINAGVIIGTGWNQMIYGGVGLHGYIGRSNIYFIRFNSMVNAFYNNSPLGPVGELRYVRILK
ncbi:MAG: hypothetical protein IPM48_12550 [Saprospiraceae bacterium]|nr:hypothetical protein [Saprospiraceae bacterium]